MKYISKYQIKQKTITREKNIATVKKYVLWKINQKFQNPKFNFLYILADILINNVKPLGLRGYWHHFETKKTSWIRL